MKKANLTMKQRKDMKKEMRSTLLRDTILSDTGFAFLTFMFLYVETSW